LETLFQDRGDKAEFAVVNRFVIGKPDFLLDVGFLDGARREEGEAGL
jgi:hypothetical protein